MNKLISDQQEPVANQTKPIWELVVKDMLDRNQAGVEKYGTPLQAFNRRNALVDVYQELLDASVYTRQLLEEEYRKKDLAINVIQQSIDDLEKAKQVFGSPTDHINFAILWLKTTMSQIQHQTNDLYGQDY